MSALKFNQWLNPNGTENFKCRAWVSFNGNGVPAIHAAGNVSGITDNGLGDFTIHFIADMPDTNYALVGTNSFNVVAINVAGVRSRTDADVLVGSVRVLMSSHSSSTTAYNDPSVGSIAIFR